MPPSVALLGPDSERWQRFAVEHATSPLQLPSWLQTLAGAYALDASILALTGRHGSIMAGLPVIASKLPWRRRWTSLPFTDALEPVAVDAASRDELLLAAGGRGDAQAAVIDRPVVVRTQVTLAGWSSREVGTTQVIDVSGGTAGVLRAASASSRRNVKRAQRQESGLTARLITSRHEFMDVSVGLIAQSRRRLGAPTQPRRYWSRVWNLHERGGALTVGVYLGGRLVATGVFILGGEHAVYKYGASDTATLHLRPNYLMFATAFDHVAKRGARTMDFGVTDMHNTSLREFKTRWGGEERPVHYSATEARLLPHTLEPGRLLTAVVQRTPMPVGRAIGSIAYPFVA